MPCASCGRSVKFERLKYSYYTIGKQHCYSIGDTRRGDLTYRLIQSVRIFIIIYLVIIIISLQWQILFFQDYEESWESVPKTIIEIDREEYVNLNGTIDSPEGVVIFRSNESDNISAIIKKDFTLIQKDNLGNDETILVNLSECRCWSQSNNFMEKSKPYFKDGDYVVIYGKVKEVNGSWVLFAEFIYDDEDYLNIDSIIIHTRELRNGAILGLVIFIGLQLIFYNSIIKKFERIFRKYSGVGSSEGSSMEKGVDEYLFIGNELSSLQGKIEMYGRRIMNDRLKYWRMLIVISIGLIVILCIINILIIKFFCNIGFSKLHPYSILVLIYYLPVLYIYNLLLFPMIHCLKTGMLKQRNAIKEMWICEEGIIFYQANVEPFSILWRTSRFFWIGNDRLYLRLRTKEMSEFHDFKNDYSMFINVKSDIIQNHINQIQEIPNLDENMNSEKNQDQSLFHNTIFTIIDWPMNSKREVF